MPTRQRAVRIPEHLGVVVRVQVDEAGGDVHAGGVDDLGTLPGIDPADSGDASAGDADVAAHPRCPGAVEDHPVLDDDVVGAHAVSHPIRCAA